MLNNRLLEVVYIFVYLLLHVSVISGEEIDINVTENILETENNTLYIDKPSVSPQKDVFTSTIEISLSLPDSSELEEDARIIYTIDGNDPRTSVTAREYSDPFTVSNSLTIKAYTVSGGRSSDVLEKAFIRIQPLPMPSVIPSDGRFVPGQKISIFLDGWEDDSSVQILYTVNDSAPVTFGRKYIGPFTLSQSRIIKAIAINPSGLYLNSPLLVKKFNIIEPIVPIPVANPSSTNFINTTSIEIHVPGFENDTGVTIYYTLDGKDPFISGSVYKGAITLTNTSELKAYAVKEGHKKSRICHEYYVLGTQKVVPRVEVNYPGGIYQGEIPPISFTCKEKSTMILYTLDGSEPEMGCILWDKEPLYLEAPVTLKVRAFKLNWIPSVTVTEKYDYETLPAPKSNVLTGTVFTDTLMVRLTVPGFEKSEGLDIYCTLDGTNPLENGRIYSGEIILTKGSLIKAAAKKTGYYSSSISMFEYFDMIKVVYAYYLDSNKDGKIETAVIHFNKPLKSYPSLIEFTDPFTGEIKKINENSIDSLKGNAGNGIKVTFDMPFNGRGSFNPGHYGRIPLPGEFDTAPFLINDGNSSVSLPLAKREINGDNISNELQYNYDDIAVITNPFIPGKSRLPKFIQDIDSYRTLTGTAVMVRPIRPSFGSAEIYDAVGNRIIAYQKLVENPSTGILYLIWDGKNKDNRIVESGTYLVVITTEEKQSREIKTIKVKIAVKED